MAHYYEGCLTLWPHIYLKKCLYIRAHQLVIKRHEYWKIDNEYKKISDEEAERIIQEWKLELL